MREARLPEELSQVKRLNRCCGVCKGEEGAVLGQLKYALFDESTLADTFEVVCCSRCGFVFCDTPSCQDDYDGFYEKYFYSSAYLDRELPAEETRYVVQTSDNLMPYLTDKAAHVFDIGCGTGQLLKRLQASGYENLYGVDPSASCVDALNRCAGIQSRVGSISRMPYDGVRADYIILSHIIEHVVDLPGALGDIDKNLSDEGLV